MSKTDHCSSGKEEAEQTVAPEILKKKTKTTALKVMIPASSIGEEVRKDSEQPSPDAIILDSPELIEPEGP